MRLAYVCADPGVPVFGSKGCSIHVLEFLRALHSWGVDTTLIAARIEQGCPADLSELSINHLPVSASKDSVQREKEAFAANETHMSVLRAQPPLTCVYERYSVWSYAGMAFARENEIPGILEVNAPLIEESEMYRNLHDRSTAESVARRAFGNATSIVAVSSAVADYVESYPEARGKVSVHANGVDVRRFGVHVKPTAEERGTFTIGFVGSLKPWHGLETLADAFALVKQVVPKARLLIVGDGPEKKNMRRQLEASGMLDYCTFAGKVSPDDIPGLLASMDVGVAPALPKNALGDYYSPLKLFEYMAMALPVVCSRSGQMRNIVESGESGLLFATGDEVDLANQLVRLAQDEALRSRLGSAARRYVVVNHSWDGIVSNILSTVDMTTTATGVN